MTVARLRELARAKGLRGYSRLRKAALAGLVLPALTVAELRAECRRLGLRGYSRLRKRGLIERLTGGSAYCASPSTTAPISQPVEPAASRPTKPVDAAADDEARIVAVLARLPDNGAGEALHRIYRGRDTVHDRKLLDGRRLEALRSLYHSTGDLRWWHQYQTAAQRFQGEFPSAGPAVALA